MKACVGRVLRLSLAVAFVSGLGFAATSAHAFVDPSLVCAVPGDILENYGDGDNWADFSAVENCSKICKSYVNKCKASVKNDLSCIKKALQDDADFERKAFCDTEPTKDAKQECKEGVKAQEQDDLDDVKAAKTELLGICEDFEADCVSECELPEP